jgi:hypothetical protein
MMKRYYFISVLMILCSCVKDKLENRLPELDVSNKSNSSIRMFNFCNAELDMTINNIPLTAYPTTSTNVGQSTQFGASIFPSGAWLSQDGGSPFTVPNVLLDKTGSIHIHLQNRLVSATEAFRKDTVIKNDVLHPLDYYVLGNGEIRVLERDNVPPGNSWQFKVRIINLGGTNDHYGLAGPVSLTYADGADISPLLNNIPQGTTSQYITLNYGAYLFRLYGSNGGGIDITKQYTEVPEYPIHNPCIATPPPQEAILNQLRTFKPGGVYSIVITPTLYTFLSCNKQTKDVILTNTYRIITEQDPGVNYTYARMQAVNAVPGKTLTVQVDGQPLSGNTLDYVGNSAPNTSVRPDYGVFIQGKHTVQVLEGSNVLATKEITLYPYDNYTVWAHPTTDDKVAILFEGNDMTGTLYTNAAYTYVPNDGSNGAKSIKRYPYAVRSRFLNLSPDLPYATFQNNQDKFLPITVGDDTLRYPGAYTNLPSGDQPMSNNAILYSIGPYSSYMLNGVETEMNKLPTLIRLYQSVPGPLPQIPGKLLSDIEPLDTRKAYIANPNLYDAGLAPYAENGVYTVAVVGNIKNGTKARIVLIKHNN